LKIGQVSAKYGISADTIYYYINYGLLVPPRVGGQQQFDAQTLWDLELILELKNLEFTLREIHQIVSLYRISGLSHQQDVEDLRSFYQNKLAECTLRRERLGKVVGQLEQKIARLGELLPASQSRLGLPLSMLDLLCCPLCGGELGISQVNMSLHSIFSGVFTCLCGYEAKIADGIMLTPNASTDIYDKPDLDRNMYKDLPPGLITLFQRSYNWMVRQLEGMSLESKVVMETYVNAWFFMHNHQQYLHPKGRYIVVDKYPETLLMYKQLMEKQNYRLDILYIADSGTRLPLRPGSVDLHIDFFAVNEHNFYHDTFLPGELLPCLSPDARLLGTYFYFQDGPRSMENLLAEYPTCYERNFSLPYFTQAMAESGFRMLEREDIGYTVSTGSNIGFSFHVEGEKMRLISYLAGRSGYSQSV